MLSEIRIKMKYQTMFQLWVEKLKAFLNDCDCSKSYGLTDEALYDELKVKIPLGSFPASSKGMFQFLKPIDVRVVGSYQLGCCVGPRAKVNIRVQIPKECFQKGDHMNLRYDLKRAMYIAFLASKLQDNELVKSLFFSHIHGNPLKPVLEMKPSGKLGNHITVVLHTSVAPEVFRLTRFSPDRSNIKANWYLGSSFTEEETTIPTPHYNTNVLRDLVFNMNEDFLSEVLENRPCIRDGILLLKVWLHQREFDQGYGCFSGFIISMYVAYLFHTKQLNGSMSSYQVVRIVWSTLAQSDWTKTGVTLATKISEPSLEEFHKYFDVVFIDVSGFCNLCADVSRETYFRVRHESELAMKFLDNTNINSFQALFMSPVKFQRQYDHLICFPDMARLGKVVKQHGSPHLKLDYPGHVLKPALTLMLDVLRQGLGQRVRLLGIQTQESQCWPCDEAPPLGPNGPVLIGLTLNPETAFSTLDKGPPANMPEAEKFRKFWGKKSELRRFQDGSICEAVFWSGNDTLAEKRVVCRQIVQFILNHHLGIPVNSYVYVANEVEYFLNQSQVLPPSISYGTGEEQTLALLHSFDGLAKQLRQVKDIPLDVSSVQGISPVFRFCEVFPPIAADVSIKRVQKYVGNTLLLTEDLLKHNRVPAWIPPIEAVIQLGLSGKWPNDLEAVRRIRAAFNVKIAKCLTDQFELSTHPYPDYVDVYKDGFVFRLRVAYQREIALLKQKITPEGLTKFQDSEESSYLEEKIVFLPTITGALHGLHQQFSSFGPTCCLAKRWLSAQLLGPPHVPELCTELLVAHLFTSPEPFEPPNEPQLGFLRFLFLISSTDWNTTPIIVNFNSELSREEVVEIENRFHSARSALPPLFIATPYDQRNSRVTREAPTLQILIRLGMLASEALTVLEKELLLSNHPDCMLVFKPPLEVYDVIIHLNPLQNPRCHEAVEVENDNLSRKSLKVYKHQSEEKIPIVGFDPVQCYLRELRDGYGDYALFFHDCYGGNIIGVLWKPVTSEEKNFKVSHVNCQKMNADGSKMNFNFEAVVEDFYIIGSGLVRTIETKEELMKAK
ncbi:nucleolar protein 6 isoform X2 [Anabrus simplex]